MNELKICDEKHEDENPYLPGTMWTYKSTMANTIYMIGINGYTNLRTGKITNGSYDYSKEFPDFEQVHCVTIEQK